MLALRKEQKLNCAADFQVLFKKGKKLVSRFFAAYGIINNRSTARLGIVVGKKALRSAVKRNQVKRIVRESFRHHQHLLINMDVMVVAFPGINKLDKTQLRVCLDSEWQKLIRTIERQ